MRRLKTEDFIERSIKKHNGKYTYEHTDLDNRDEKGRVLVTCPIHGDFLIDPTNHLRGVGCGKCNGGVRYRTTEMVLEEIKSIHGDKYIIPNDFEYISNKTNFKVICPIHGEFTTNYTNLVKHKHGCNKCCHHLYEIEEFREDLRKIYGEKFNFDNTIFKGYRNDVNFVCKNCGKTLKARPKRLLDGHYKCECECNPMTILENEVASFLSKENIEYVYNYKNDEWLKLKGQLSLDFYLPKYKIAIECQGRFHFEPYKNNDEKSIIEYNTQYNRDVLKYELCKEHGIKVFYYSNIDVKNYFAPIYKNINEIIIK